MCLKNMYLNDTAENLLGQERGTRERRNTNRSVVLGRRMNFAPDMQWKRCRAQQIHGLFENRHTDDTTRGTKSHRAYTAHRGIYERYEQDKSAKRRGEVCGDEANGWTRRMVGRDDISVLGTRASSSTLALLLLLVPAFASGASAFCSALAVAWVYAAVLAVAAMPEPSARLFPLQPRQKYVVMAFGVCARAGRCFFHRVFVHIGLSFFVPLRPSPSTLLPPPLLLRLLHSQASRSSRA